ncbi:hypothetical protein MFMK1_001146 [Metallumcola ferriviriculae]|uniref:N-acetyltransferase n=1 Tax=Metallumcola ferriviriculae TaxID=3039180 RepID=A0AAU0UJ42_9FIRM|nr:hypothetical protein MFMK1_001146 [Desulfitibacteraceae bacterium MK1]
MSDYLELRKFGELNLEEQFFDSLKEDYPGFEGWFLTRLDKQAYVYFEEEFIQGFLYLKLEEGPVRDVTPNISNEKVLKIGTCKINPHGTRLGERFIKKALDYAIVNGVEVCYVTIFEKHKALIELLMRYGFYHYGIKETENGQELVLVKDMEAIRDDVLLDYPLISQETQKKYLLAIYPKYHTKMFPDSILKTETFDILEDVSYTNSIHKIYVCSMPVYMCNPGDIIVIYRTSDGKGHAEYRSVATSICVVEEVYSKDDFRDFDEFFKYANTYSIFDRDGLRPWFKKKECYTIRMTYNAALTKRLIRKNLSDTVGLDRTDRWSFLELSDEQFEKIIKLGKVNRNIFVD